MMEEQMGLPEEQKEIPRTVTDVEIGELKKQHAVLFRITICEQDFVFRPLTYNEWVSIASSSTSDEMKTLQICKICVVWPPNFDPVEWKTREAGILPNLSAVILDESGFKLPDPPVELYRAEVHVPPSTQEVEKLKSKYQRDLFLANIAGRYYVFRILTWREFEGLQIDPSAFLSPRGFEAMTKIAKEAVVWPEGIEWEEIPAGVPIELGTMILEASGLEMRVAPFGPQQRPTPQKL